ncbi:hypothetical protein ACWIGD_30395 [Streptomyces albidoflavus]
MGDRDAATGLLERLRRLHRDLTLVWADGGYTGNLVDWCRDELALTLEIIKKPSHLGHSVFCASWWGSLSGWCRTSCGSCSSGWCRRRRRDLRAVVGVGTVTGKCWPRSSS